MIELMNTSLTMKEPPPNGDIVLRFLSSASDVNLNISIENCSGTIRLSNGTTKVLTASNVIVIPAGVTGATINMRKYPDVIGSYSRIFSANLVEVVDWSGVDISRISFGNSSKLVAVPAVFPKTLTSCLDMFFGCSLLNDSNISLWDTGRITDMTSMFINCSAFNQNLNEWNTSNVTSIRSMFSYAINYNQPMNKWDVSKVRGVNNFVAGANKFNQNLSNWIFVGFPITEQGIGSSATAWTAANKPKFV